MSPVPFTGPDLIAKVLGGSVTCLVLSMLVAQLSFSLTQPRLVRKNFSILRHSHEMQNHPVSLMRTDLGLLK